MDYFKNIKSKKYVLIGIVMLIATVVAAGAFAAIDAYANEDYWNVKIGDKTVVVLTSENSAKQVVKEVKNYYVKEGAIVKAIECTPQMSVEMQSYRVSDKPELYEVKDAVEYIVTGTKEQVTYTVKEGETFWDIAMKNGFTYEELAAMNKGIDDELIHPGDKLKFYKMKPLVNVKVTQQVTSVKKIKYKTIKRKSSDLLLNTTKVKREGVNGKKKVTEVITSVNGVINDRDVLSSKVLKKPKNKIVLKGTAELPAPTAEATSSSYSSYSDGATYSGDGQAIANYALQFVGNPYRYGGSSLTNGADCSGFVMAVYAHFGISMAHDATAMRSYGREVSWSEAKPGDLVCHYGHVGIYVGGGQIVHAVNEGMGIAVTGASYTGPVISIRRVVE